MLNIEFFQKKTRELAEFFLNHKYSKISSHCLTTFASLDAKWNMVQPHLYATATNSPVRCVFRGSDECGASAPRFFYLPLCSSSSCSETISMSFNQHFPWTVYLDATTSILKCLCYSRGIGQVQIRYFSSARYKRKCIEMGTGWIYMWLGGCLQLFCPSVFGLVLMDEILMDEIKRLPRLFWQGFKLRTQI